MISSNNFLSCLWCVHSNNCIIFFKGQFPDKTINWFLKVTKSFTNSLRRNWTKRTVVGWQMVSKLPHDNSVLWNTFRYLGWNRTATCGTAVAGGCWVKIFSNMEVKSLRSLHKDSFILWFIFLLTFESAPSWVLHIFRCLRKTSRDNT